MSELIFGPSAEWLPLSELGIEFVQPRLDGGYDMPKVKLLGEFICRNVVKLPNPNQPSLFDEIDGTICETEITEYPTLFDEDSNEY